MLVRCVYVCAQDIIYQIARRKVFTLKSTSLDKCEVLKIEKWRWSHLFAVCIFPKTGHMHFDANAQTMKCMSHNIYYNFFERERKNCNYTKVVSRSSNSNQESLHVKRIEWKIYRTVAKENRCIHSSSSSGGGIQRKQMMNERKMARRSRERERWKDVSNCCKRLPPIADLQHRTCTYTPKLLLKVIMSKA